MKEEPSPKKLIQNRLKTHCKKPVTVFIDDYTIYTGLEQHPQVKEHKIINHSHKEYAKGEIHVNNCENRHSLLRQYLRIFKAISKK